MLTIRGESVANTRDVFCCQFAGKKLKNTDGFFGKSDPFLIISRLVGLACLYCTVLYCIAVCIVFYCTAVYCRTVVRSIDFYLCCVMMLQCN